MINSTDGLEISEIKQRVTVGVPHFSEIISIGGIIVKGSGEIKGGLLLAGMASQAHNHMTILAL